jgi:hypothetical protein
VRKKIIDVPPLLRSSSLRSAKKLVKERTSTVPMVNSNSNSSCSFVTYNNTSEMKIRGRDSFTYITYIWPIQYVNLAQDRRMNLRQKDEIMCLFSFRFAAFF